jgi:general secretion pathway protein B
MSYILAALKKADQEHFLGSVPDLATPQEVQPAEPRSFRWQWAIIALLVVNTVLVVLLLKDRTGEVAAPPAAELTTNAAPEPVPFEAPVPPAPQTPPVAQQEAQAVPQTTDTLTSTAPAAEKRSPPALEEPASAGGEVVILPETAQTRNLELSYLPDEEPDTSADDMTAPREEPQLQNWFDLPQAFRNNLDLPRLDVHVYSENPQGRFIMVDLKKYREGQTLPNGMVLEEILPDGMVMSYQGERFRVNK